MAASVNDEGDLLAQAARRRTFAIISHPDAGKTTLTEKFLLYAQDHPDVEFAELSAAPADDQLVGGARV